MSKRSTKIAECPYCGTEINEPTCWCGQKAEAHAWGKLDHQFLIECPKCKEVFNPSYTPRNRRIR